MKTTHKLFLGAAAGLLALAGCTSDADVVSENISTDADNFKINRRIVMFNGITDEYVLEIQGWCNIQVDKEEHQLEVTCKLPSGFKKHFFGLSDNLGYFVEQVDATNVSTKHYKVIFKPSVVIPDVEAR